MWNWDVLWFLEGNKIGWPKLSYRTSRRCFRSNFAKIVPTFFRMQSHNILFALSTAHVKSHLLDSICAGIDIVILHGCQHKSFTCCKLAETLWLSLRGKRKGTIVANFEKMHLWVMLHVDIGLFFTRNIFGHEFRACYHVAFVGSSQLSILWCLGILRGNVKYAAGTTQKSTQGESVSTVVVLLAWLQPL